MTQLNGTKKSRLKLATYTIVSLFAMCGIAMWQDMEGVATAAIGGVITIAPSFILGDSYRKSDKV